MSKHSATSPPRWPLRLLRRVLNPNYWEELEGDMEERFYEDLQKHGLAKARRRYSWGAIKLLRPALVKQLSGDVRLNQYGMLRHNLIITLRNFLRYKMSFLINLVGLSSGLACVLLIYLWVNDEQRIDKFHDNASRLFHVLKISPDANGDRVTRDTAPVR
ncbi:MAG: permease prefix domain 2-containing transporter, partial [Bacteroidota bacterium]